MSSHYGCQNLAIDSIEKTNQVIEEQRQALSAELSAQLQGREAADDHAL